MTFHSLATGGGRRRRQRRLDDDVDMFADVRHVLEKVLALVNHHPVEEFVETKVDGNRTQPLKGYVTYPSDVRYTNNNNNNKKDGIPITNHGRCIYQDRTGPIGRQTDIRNNNKGPTRNKQTNKQTKKDGIPIRNKVKKNQSEIRTTSKDKAKRQGHLYPSTHRLRKTDRQKERGGRGGGGLCKDEVG